MNVQSFPLDEALGLRSHPGVAPAPGRRGPKALFILDGPSQPLIYTPEIRSELETLADFYAPPQTRESIARDGQVLADVEVIFSGWGAPIMDEAFLRGAPNLRAVFYGAGTVGYCTSDAFWDRGILISSAAVANAVPVAEYTLGVILLSLKNFWKLAAEARQGRGWGNQTRHFPGGYDSTVALIGCGAVARRLIKLLEPLDVRCIVCDPFLSQDEAAELGVALCSLDAAFRLGDVVSLHAPSKPETYGMITGAHLAEMKPGATFINTARGDIVREAEMIDVLAKRPDLTAILDVCQVEPAPLDSPLFSMDNVVISPHISGSHGPECARLGSYMLQEFKRYLAGEPLQWRVTRDILARTA